MVSPGIHKIQYLIIAVIVIESARVIYTSGSSVMFEIPEYLRYDKSLQLIWSKNDSTQCVCPPVERFISQCACNAYYPSNLISISDNHLSIFNLTQEMGEGEVSLFFVSSVSSGCLGTCNLRSIAAVYRIVVTQGRSKFLRD
jgi:hypothetical protein